MSDHNLKLPFVFWHLLCNLFDFKYHCELFWVSSDEDFAGDDKKKDFSQKGKTGKQK